MGPCILCDGVATCKVVPNTNDDILKHLQWPVCTSCVDNCRQQLEAWINGYIRKWHGGRYV